MRGLSSKTISELDMSGLDLVRYAIRTMREDGLVADVEAELEAQDTCSPARRVLLPPVEAVLGAGIYLIYVRGELTLDAVWLSLRHYWNDEEAEALGIGEWRRDIEFCGDPRSGDTCSGAVVTDWANVVLAALRAYVRSPG